MMIYPQTKKGVFNVETHVYDKTKGWLTKEQACTILGETEFEYITRFFLSSAGNDVDGNYMGEHTSCTGIHKSRFVRWLN